METLLKIDRAITSTIMTALIMTLGIYVWDPEYFTQTFAAEDGLVEYTTALALFIAGIILIKNALSLRTKAPLIAALLTGLYALMFLAAAGEELSWGQRIFGWESSAFFMENNWQDETNFHNLVVGDTHLTKTLFGPILTLIILLYLVVLPFVYTRSTWIHRIADCMAVPVPGKRHAALAILASLIMLTIQIDRKWEVYELVFGLLALSVFLLPQNRNKTS